MLSRSVIHIVGLWPKMGPLIRPCSLIWALGPDPFPPFHSFYAKSTPPSHPPPPCTYRLGDALHDSNQGPLPTVSTVGSHHNSIFLLTYSPPVPIVFWQFVVQHMYSQRDLPPEQIFEPGTNQGSKYVYNQSWARNNSVATMWPCFQGTKLFVIAILLYLLWLPLSRHWGLTMFRLFSGPWLVPEAMLHCRVVALSLLLS